MSYFFKLFGIFILVLLSACSGKSNNNIPLPAPTIQNLGGTYDRISILKAASDYFGEGSEAIASLVEKSFLDFGAPNGYIIGTEVSAAFIVGLRYGDGTLSHKIEGDSPVYWKGPSIGIDAGANGSRVFALVYNLNDTEELYQLFPAIEGSFYYVAGFGMNYQQSGKIIIAPIRLGTGLRAGVNLGYLQFSKKMTWNPF